MLLYMYNQCVTGRALLHAANDARFNNVSNVNLAFHFTALVHSDTVMKHKPEIRPGFMLPGFWCANF